jgi:hypothetical protein
MDGFEGSVQIKTDPDPGVPKTYPTGPMTHYPNLDPEHCFQFIIIETCHHFETQVNFVGYLLRMKKWMLLIDCVQSVLF